DGNPTSQIVEDRCGRISHKTEKYESRSQWIYDRQKCTEGEGEELEQEGEAGHRRNSIASALLGRLSLESKGRGCTRITRYGTFYSCPGHQEGIRGIYAPGGAFCLQLLA